MLLKTKIQFGYLGIMITSVSIFCVGIKNPDVRIRKCLEYISVKLSLFIYIFHSLISKTVLMGFSFLRISVDGVYQWVHPILTLFLTICFSAMINEIISRASKKE